MGHASSKEVHHEPQSTRRLSKPPTKLSSLNAAPVKPGKTPKCPDYDQTQPLDESMFWKSPWTGDLLPKSNPETQLTERNRVKSFTSFSNSQNDSRGSLQGSKRWSSIDDFVLMKQDSSLSRSSSFLSRKLSRRSSTVQRSGSNSQSEGLTVGETRREPVIHFGPSDIGSHDLHSSVEILTAEDRSPIEDSRVLLGRRRSFRTPGVATRTPSWGLYRTPLSSIQQEDEKQGPLPGVPASHPPCELEEEDEYMPVLRYHGRATSPVALDYSHLSGFRKGTLRIVNASVSPASTDRIRLLTTPQPNKNIISQADSTAVISNSAHQDETVVVPEDTFYFEDFEPVGGEQFPGKTEIPISEALDHTGMQDLQSHTNADSGYSSVSSIYSGNSSGPPESSPTSSPVSSPSRYEAGSPPEKISYFAKGASKSKDVFQDLAICQNKDSESRQVPHGFSEQIRYYAQLSPLSIPSVPDAIGIYDKESDYDGSEVGMDDKQTQSPFSPILPKHAFTQVTNKHIEEISQPTIPSHFLPTDKARNFEAPRGRTRSRSVGRGRSKLTKSRKDLI